MRGTCPGVFWRLVGGRGSRKEANQLWFASLHTLRVSHTMGLPSHFLTAPNPNTGPCLPESVYRSLKGMNSVSIHIAGGL